MVVVRREMCADDDCGNSLRAHAPSIVLLGNPFEILYNPSLQDRNRPTGLLLSNSLIEELTGVYLVEGLRDYPLWLALQIAAEGDTNLTKSQQHLKVLGPHHKFLPALSDIM